MNDYIGATGNFPINDYIDYTSNTNFIYTSNTSNNIINYYKNLIDYKLESGINNTYIYNCNVGGEIKFFIPVPYYDPIDNASGQPYRVKINPLGKLYLYYNYNIAISLTDTEGWYDVINLLMGTRASVNTQGLAIGVIQGQIAGITLSINQNNTVVQTALQTISKDINDNIRPSIANATENLALTNLTRLDLSKSQFTNSIIGNFESFLSRLGNNKYVSGGLGLTGAGGIIFSIAYGAIQNDHTAQIINNIIDYQLNCNLNLSVSDKNDLSNLASNLLISNVLKYNCNLCNLCLFNGFINSNIIDNQFIPSLKSNKILLGNITTPNVAYQMEMTGDLNLNMLYLNSTSLSSLLNQKQGNLTFTQPLYNTTNTIGINYDSSLTKIGNNLSVVKTATTPIIITGNDFSLSYDSSLTKIGNNLSVVKTASLPLSISASHNFSLNYDSTLTLSGNNLKVAAGTASKWSQSGNIIYNNNIGNVGINTISPIQKIHIEKGSIFLGDSAYTSTSVATANGYKIIFDNTYNGTAGTGNICNKLMLHNFTTWCAGFGLESSALVYQSGERHRFYTGTSQTVYGFLSAEIYRDNFRFYGSTNAGAGGVISNGNNGASAYSYLSLANDTGNGILFLNSSTKTTDGGANTLTLRNDITGGDLRLSANLDTPYIYLKKSTGRVGISHNNPTSRFTIKAIYDNVDSGLCLDSSDNGTNSQYNFKIYPYVVGGGAVGVKFRIVNNTNTTLDALAIKHDGNTIFNYPVSFPVNVWNKSNDGYNRFYFGNTSRTYFSSGSGYEWRHSTDAGIAVMSVTGQLGLQNLSPIGTLSLGDSSVSGSDGSLVIHKRDSGGGTRHMKMGFYTSTFDLVIGDFGNNNTPGTWVRGFGMGYSAPDYSLYIYGTGPVFANYGYISGSDMKIKTDIKTIDNALWKVEQLRGVEYKLILNNETTIGLIAQEVEYIIPEVVGYNDKTDTKTINYNGLIGLLVEAIKDLKGEINNLNKRIELLEK